MTRSEKTALAIEKYSRSGFSWGVSDCVQFVALVVSDVTGRKLGSGFEYRTKREAQDIISRHGSLRGLVSGVLQESPCDPEMTRDGDPLLVISDEGELMAVRLGDSAVYKTVKRMAWCPVGDASCGWRID